MKPSLRMFAVLAVLAGCRQSAAERLVRPPELELPGQSKCSVGGNVSHPLVVEWAAADRASLEARLGGGLVAVRAAGCEIEVKGYCKVAGGYQYMGLTRKNDRVKIRNADELYAQLPLGAASLEAKLARKGALDVEIALVGMLSATQRPRREHLSGECEDATHVITGVQVGAFQFYAGGSGEIRASGGFKQIGAGASSEAEREMLSADGQPASCDASTTKDTRPPEGCGALIRIELTPIEGAKPVAVAGVAGVCGEGMVRSGQQCVPGPCPVGQARSAGGACVTTPSRGGGSTVATGPASGPAPAKAAPVSEEAALCRRGCERDLACKAAAAGRAEPEGEGRESYLQMCQKMCEFAVNDFNRGELRRCLAVDTCEEFDACGNLGEDGTLEN